MGGKNPINETFIITSDILMVYRINDNWGVR